MKKFTLLLTALFLMAGIVHSQIISQYIETDSGTEPKGIEIWNNTDTELDFSVNELVVEKGTNGNDPAPDFTLSEGTLAAGDVLVAGTADLQEVTENNGAVFYEKSFTFNGNDALVVKYGGTITDVFGEPGVDPGSAWQGNGVSTKNQNIALLSGITSGDTEGWSDPSSRFETISETPSGDNGDEGFGIAPESGGNASPTIAEIAIFPEEPGSEEAVTVTAEITDPDGTVEATELYWGTESGNLTNTIAMVQDAGDTYTTQTAIPAQPNGTTVFYQLYAADDEDAETYSSEMSYMVSDSETILYEPFEVDLNTWTSYSTQGPQEWYWGDYGNPPGSANMSGYEGGAVANEDWLVSPAMDFSLVIEATLDFDEAINYGTGNIENEQEVYISSDYSGSGDPAADGTWEKLTVTGRSSGDSWDFVSVDQVDISDYAQKTEVYVAFRYVSTTDGAATWEVDNVLVRGIFDVSAPQTNYNPQVSLYPNPASKHVTVQTDAFNNAEYRIITLTGSVVDEGRLQGQHTLKLSHLQSGVYMLQLQNDQKTAVKRLIVR
ncbi:MAG: choice-of-anchor J domain-containing protein [Bacteroidales bacterium]|nr:choice-of-anchor J domain-containing protein [Bacteroidales bacterium]